MRTYYLSGTGIDSDESGEQEKKDTCLHVAEEKDCIFYQSINANKNLSGNKTSEKNKIEQYGDKWLV